jgi:hypothetical protein
MLYLILRRTSYSLENLVSGELLVKEQVVENYG